MNNYSYTLEPDDLVVGQINLTILANGKPIAGGSIIETDWNKAEQMAKQTFEKYMAAAQEEKQE